MADDMAASTAAAKQRLRSLMKHQLSLLSEDSIARQSRQILETLQGLRPYQDAKRVSIFLSMPQGEIQTDAIVRHALKSGKQVFVPYLHKSTSEAAAAADTPMRVMDMVRLKNVQDYESLKRDRWGIPSVDPASVHERQRILGGSDVHHPDHSVLDLVLVPGVAFDVDEAGQIRRLGHGKGFYDFFINRYIARAAAQQASGGQSSPMRLYGLALTEQLLPPNSETQIPTGPYDRELHGLILGSGEAKESLGHSF